MKKNLFLFVIILGFSRLNSFDNYEDFQAGNNESQAKTSREQLESLSPKDRFKQKFFQKKKWRNFKKFQKYNKKNRGNYNPKNRDADID